MILITYGFSWILLDSTEKAHFHVIIIIKIHFLEFWLLLGESFFTDSSLLKTVW